jgi:excinuclease ABC subunit A
MVIDRFLVRHDAESVTRYSDSVQAAFTLGHGACWIMSAEEGWQKINEHFSDRFEADGISFEEPSELMFSFNSPVGACPVCEGYGSIIGIDENLVVPDKNLSVYEDAIACWKGEKMSRWKEKLILQAEKFDFPVHKPYYQLTDEQKRLLWEGNRYFPGINAFFKHLEEKKYKIQYRVMLSRYRGRTVCPECKGSRLKKQAEWVKIGGISLPELIRLSLKEVTDFFRSLHLNAHEREVSARLLEEILSRLEYLEQVGLGYLTLNRLSSTLSGGEMQRIRLATQLGSNLTGSLYILDEPSIGLHPRDTRMLVHVLQQLRDVGNTVMVVEHDEEIIRAADIIVDIGPGAGRLGGEVVFCGTHNELLKSKNSLTAEYLTGKREIPVPLRRRKWNNSIEITGARENNLKNINVRFPLNVLTVVTGVSGSGKSSLVCDVLYPALKRAIDGSVEKTGQFKTLRGDVKAIRSVEMVDQNPIGRSSRSNPVTYIKAWDEVRKLYAAQPVAKHFQFGPSHFSFNVEGGRCEECQGEGVIHIEMQFMADVTLVCESCHGKRFKEDVLEVTFQGASIVDVLEMTVDEAIAFFSRSENSMSRRIAEKLQPLADVGLGYIKLGQPSSTLSGGENQRVKLASFLSHEHAEGGTVFIFDEPTTGLHFHDISKLLDAFQALIEKGNSIIVIEHNPEVIKCADWVIDLGPESGDKGGMVVCEGTPEKIATCKQSYTGVFLRKKLKGLISP